MKKICFLLILSLCFTLSACSGKGNIQPSLDISSSNVAEEAGKETQTYMEEESEVEENLSQTEEIPASDSEPKYFESDEVVDQFFVAYNATAEVTIPAEKIEKGNIQTKALAYIDDLCLEIANAKDFLSVSMSASVENEETKLFAVFRDSIKAMRENLANEDIQSAWEAIHETGYLVEDYDFNGISITYVPSKELSWGTSDLRVDLEIPLN